MDNVKNKTAIITGAASGIGYRYTEVLLRNGVKNIAIIDLPTSNGPNVVTTLEKEFGKGCIIFIACDVTKSEELRNAFKKVINAFNGLDILINNAGILDDTRWENTIDLNVTAVIRFSMLAIDYMGKHKDGKGGLIVNISSIAGLHPLSSLPVYTATKCAIIGFSQSLAVAYNKTGIRVVTMCPGATTTSLIADLPHKVLDFVDTDDDKSKKFPLQPPEHVALAMLQLIQKGKNGAVWVCEGNQPPYAVDFPHYSKRSLPI